MPYSCLVTAPDGCTKEVEFLVVYFGTGQLIVPDITACSGENVLIEARTEIFDNGNFYYVWQNTEGDTIQQGVGLNTLDLGTVEENQVYIVSVNEPGSPCSPVSDVVSIDIVQEVTFQIPTSYEVCEGEDIQLQAIPQPFSIFQFDWTLPDGSIQSSIDSIAILDLTNVTVGDAGLYQVLATDTITGCTYDFETRLLVGEAVERTLFEFTCDSTLNNTRDTLFDNTILGCDSLTITRYQYSEPRIERIQTASCFAQSNDTMRTPFPITGCDSLIQITEYQVEGTLTPTNINIPTCDEALNGAMMIDTIAITNGCDSIVISTFNYTAPQESRSISTTCNPNTVGFDTIPFTNPITGCDTLIQITEYQLGDLIPPTNINLVTCDATLDGNIMVDTFAVASGCDSIVISTFNYLAPQENRTTIVTCNPNEVDIDTMVFTNSITGCDTFLLITETTYTAAMQVEDTNFTCFDTEVGMSIDTILNISGCDSLIVMRNNSLYPDLVPADAGNDIAVCLDDYLELSANQPSNTTGYWSPPINLLEDPNDPNTAFTNTRSSGSYELVWRLSTATCTNYSSDTVSVAIALSPTVVDDQFEIAYPLQLQTDLSTNDILRGTSWTVRITKAPGYGEVRLLGDGGNIRYVPEQYVNDVYFEYEICADACPQSCDEGRVDITFGFQKDVLSNDGFTPNDDGKNDTFVIPELKEFPDEFPNNEVVIFNRWGDIVFQRDDYQNDWRGHHMRTQRPLPSATYYYIVRLRLADRIIRYGQVTIIR